MKYSSSFSDSHLDNLLTTPKQLSLQVALLIQLLLSTSPFDQQQQQDRAAATADESLLFLEGDASTLTQLSRSTAANLANTGLTNRTAAATGKEQQQQQQQSVRLLQLLRAIDFEEETAHTPTWEVFDAAQVLFLLLISWKIREMTLFF